MKTQLVFEGPLAIWDQKGGKVAPMLLIGKESVSDHLAGHFRQYATQAKGGQVGAVPGYYRLTVEEIEPPPELLRGKFKEGVSTK